MRIIATAAIAMVSVAAAVTTAMAGPALAAPAATGRSVPAPAATTVNGALSGVACQSDKNCLAVGPATTAESWNGKAWHTVSVKLPAGSTGHALYGVACPGTGSAKTECVAVGAASPKKYGIYYTSLTDVWNGKAWTPTQLSKSALSPLNSVSCVAGKDCLAVGTDQAPVGGDSSGIAYDWNGSTWTQLDPPVPPSNVGSSFNGVSCPTKSFCVVVGKTGPLGTTLSYAWNGKSWTVETAVAPKSVTSPGLGSVSCTSPASCVALGNGTASGKAGAFAEVWNGKTWKLTPAINWGKGAVTPGASSISCVTAGYCVAVGTVQASGSKGRAAAAAVWNGKSWAPAPVAAPAKGSTSNFRSVTCLMKSFCVAVGQRGKLGSTTAATELTGFWNGKTWHLVDPR